MFQWFSRMFGGAKTAAPSSPSAAPAADRGGAWTLRRWEAADTTRLNKAHWQNARGQSINQDLHERLKTLRIRCAHEAANNPFVEGVINTHCVDVVGAKGPSLQVLSDNENYNESLEQIVREWFKEPELTGLSGPDLLACAVRSYWLNGEYVWQLVTDMDAKGPVKFRVLDLHPERLDTPWGQTNPQIVMGVELNKLGRPTRYYIIDQQQFGPFKLITTDYQPVPADMIIHGYKRLEAGQVRGAPWLAPCLDVIADIRDFDVQVLDAARQAADLAVVLTTEHEDATYFEANEEVEIERRMITNAPPGWKFNQVIPVQPGTTYVEYRNERLRELGRPVNMPLMTIRLGSEDHNYASARFDGQVYQRGLGVIQAGFERTALAPLVAEVAREATLAGELPPAPNKTIELSFTWPKPPHVDRKKEADGERIELENGTLAYSDACAAHGNDMETTIAKRKRAQKLLAEAGLPPLPTPQIKAGKELDDEAPPKPRVRRTVRKRRAVHA